MCIGTDSDDEFIAERAGVLQVLNVAGVNDVEAPMAMHDGPALLAGVGPHGQQTIEIADLLARSHSS